jgi:pyruvate formate lyase activating enzyme
MHCGKCADACVFGAKQLIGEEMTVAEISNICVSDIAFYRNSGGGVTLSGGEPALYPAFAIALFDDLRSKGIHTALLMQRCIWQENVISSCLI